MDYDEGITAAVAQTKRNVAAHLPEDRRGDLRNWVEEHRGQEVLDASAESSAEVVKTPSGSRALRDKVFATQYIAYIRYGAALPYRRLKFGNQLKVLIRRVAGGNVVRPRFK